MLETVRNGGVLPPIAVSELPEDRVLDDGTRPKDYGDFMVYNAGSGIISIHGMADRLILENEGSGKFKGFQFTVSNCDIENMGSGDCEVNVTNQLDLDIEGSGDVYYKGTPAIDAKISGSGKVVNAN